MCLIRPEAAYRLDTACMQPTGVHIIQSKHVHNKPLAGCTVLPLVGNGSMSEQHVRLRSLYVRTETARSATEPIRSARCVQKFGRKVHVRKSAENPSELRPNKGLAAAQSCSLV